MSSALLLGYVQVSDGTTTPPTEASRTGFFGAISRAANGHYQIALETPVDPLTCQCVVTYDNGNVPIVGKSSVKTQLIDVYFCTSAGTFALNPINPALFDVSLTRIVP